MKYRFADRVAKMDDEAIAVILKATLQPNVISFAGGLPAPELFPAEEIKKCCEMICDQEGHQVLQYGPTEGRPSLRQRIADRQNRLHNTHLKKENIMITTGSQQTIDLAGKVFLNKGDVVLMEAPTYMAAINAFKAYECQFKEVPTDENGIQPEALDKILDETPNAKLIYVIPEFQNPTGLSWTLERRKKFMEVVKKHQIPVLEDNPYGELRYEGTPLPSLLSMDDQDLVMGLGTFSKIFCPGLRLGWLSAPEKIIKAFAGAKQNADLSTSTFDQAIADTYMANFDLDAHVREINKLYRHRRDLLEECLTKYVTDGTTWTHPDGGLFLWLTFPEGVNSKDVFDICLKNNVAAVMGDIFYAVTQSHNHMRVNFSNMPDDKIVEGVKRLAAALKQASGK
jgi:2-aminoadipate transaminase